MFDILFGWRKASKCKKLIKLVQCRLKLLKNKRCSIVRQLREDLAQLLKIGDDQSAFNRVEQLFKDESIVAVYDLLDHFCEFIIIHLSYIRKHKDCPNDINEAVSSLIFASARCGDLPELRVIRKLFGERYGQRFAMAALELLPGNLVNRQIKENLSIKSVPDDVKCRLVDEIARSCLQPRLLALEYSTELQQQQLNKKIGDQVPDNNVCTNYSGTEGSQMQASKSTATEQNIVSVNFFSDGKKFLTEPFDSHQDSDTTGTSTCSTVPQTSPNTVESSMYKEGKVEKYSKLNSPYEFKVSESPSQLPEEMIYLDGIEEFQSPTSEDGNNQDQRLFMFKSPVLLNSMKFEGGYNEGYVEQHESWSEKTGSRSSRKSGKASGKRLRRSASWESSSVKDVECAIYYCEVCENSPNHYHKSHHRRKHQKKIPMVETQDSYCAQERVQQPCCVKIGSNFVSGTYRYDKMKSCCSCSVNNEMLNDCSLEHPCYFCITDDKDDRESSTRKEKMRITTLEGFPIHDPKEEEMQCDNCSCRCSCNGEPNNQEMVWAFLPQKPRRKSQNDGALCDILSYPSHLPNKQSKKVEREAEESDYLGSRASICSCSSTVSPWTRNEAQHPYMRAMTMPPERPKDSYNDNIIRFNSFPFRQSGHLNNGSSPRHVHPKLPDYDELAAKFTALKKANLQEKHH
ncbi:hypothetical protein F0562_008388 [Nyssa sinensis]|uniref:IST1-like protein n=1 Tax=Nyssa sinensis TaxID=561372 RepID=A0A5J5A800_9ASTE|nr:hypothetical protein F0562_008388 [Nyssa sinensis]